jgi:hypothetical protein
MIGNDVRYWPLADMPLAPTNVGFGGKADITVDGPECPLMTQSRHARHDVGIRIYADGHEGLRPSRPLMTQSAHARHGVGLCISR